MVNQVKCVDCLAEGITTVRPVKAGKRKPRCATHDRAARRRSESRSHARMVQSTYGITQEQYWAIYGAQGGKCAICQVATGKTKRLAVDHDHTTGEVRGLLCGPCNQTIGRLPTGSLVRALNYLHDPPARRVLSSDPAVIFGTSTSSEG